LKLTRFYKAFLRPLSSPHKFLMSLPVCEIHGALHFILTFFTFRAEARPISVARQTGWRRSLRYGSRHLRQSSGLRALVAQIHISQALVLIAETLIKSCFFNGNPASFCGQKDSKNGKFERESEATQGLKRKSIFTGKRVFKFQPPLANA